MVVDLLQFDVGGDGTGSVVVFILRVNSQRIIDLFLRHSTTRGEDVCKRHRNLPCTIALLVLLFGDLLLAEPANVSRGEVLVCLLPIAGPNECLVSDSMTSVSCGL
jgi:hypothetical protein